MVLGIGSLLNWLGSLRRGGPSTADEGALLSQKLLGMTGSVMCVSAIHIGYKLGFFDALKDGPLTVEELAVKSGGHCRYVKEWCLNLAANGCLEFDSSTEKYSMSAVQATFFVQKDHPNHSMMGAVLIAMATIQMRGKLTEHFKSGGGYTYNEMPPDAVLGCKAFFAPVYEGLLPRFLKALEAGVNDRLKAGIKVADVGCGCGKSTLVMARLFPKSTFRGYDIDKRAIDIAKADQSALNISNAEFQVKDSTSEGSVGEFDLLTFFDCLHDMNDPRGAVAHAFEILKPGGTVFLIEPLAAADDGHAAALALPITAAYSGFGIHACIPSGLSEGGEARGGGMGPTCPTVAFEKMFKEAGFSSFKGLPLDSATAAGFRVMQALK